MSQLLASTMLLLQAVSMGDVPTVEAEAAERYGSATGADGPTTVDVTDVVARPDGSLYVVDPGKPSVERWTAAGRLRTRFGRKGRGPGEYRVPIVAGLVGDTLWVRDGGFRFVLFTPGGGPAHLVRLPGTSAPGRRSALLGAGFPLQGVALLSDGSVLAAPEAPLTRRTTGTGRRRSYFLLSRSGEVHDTLLSGILSEGRLRISVDPGRPQAVFVTGNPFGGGDLAGVQTDGSAVVVARRPPGKETGEIRSVAVTALAPSGAERWHRELSLESYADRDASVRQAIRRAVERQMRAHRREAAENTQIDPDEEALSRGFREALQDALEHLPVSDLVVGSDGSVLIRRTLPAPDGQQLWILLSPDGEPVARVRVPADVDVMDIQDGRIWGTTRGRLGVEYVTKLTFPSGP